MTWAMFGWTMVRDTRVHRYYENRDGRRKVVKVNTSLHQPIDRKWLNGGEWSKSPKVAPVRR